MEDDERMSRRGGGGGVEGGRGVHLVEMLERRSVEQAAELGQACHQTRSVPPRLSAPAPSQLSQQPCNIHSYISTFFPVFLQLCMQ